MKKHSQRKTSTNRQAPGMPEFAPEPGAQSAVDSVPFLLDRRCLNAAWNPLVAASQEVRRTS
jgi:hypothetical protein